MDKPNILIILSDQLRRQALHCYGDPDARTENIDRLAAESACFTNACSTYPVCVPFRFTLMTGEPAHSRGIPAIEWVMSPTERTLADEFNDAGYETVYIGKWHLDGSHARMGSPRQCGLTPVPRAKQGRWQRWFGFDLRNDPFDTYYFIDDNPTPHRIDGYQTDGLFDLGMDFLRGRSGEEKPFCMVISVEPPHPPFKAPADLESAWLERDITLPSNFSIVDDALRKQHIDNRKIYYAMVENLDQNVGRLRTFLDEHNLAEDTLVVFMADHGEMNGAHGFSEKQRPYEESVGIPLLVFDPRRSDTNHVIRDPVCTEDLFPTLLGLAGLKPKTEKYGVDLAPLIRGEQKGLDRKGVLLEFVAELRDGMPFYKETWRAFRSERFVYTVKGDKFGARPWQFFDLQNDPFQTSNLIDAPEQRSEIRRHHEWLVNELLRTEDHFVLLPAFGVQGVNLWNAVSPAHSPKA